MLHGFNATAHALPETTLVELLQQGMDRDPHAPALVFGDTTLDYVTLEARSFALAAQLRAMDVGGQRGGGGIAALAGAGDRAAGGAACRSRLPLDLAHPDERLARILASAQPVCVMAASEVSARMAGVPVLTPEQWTALSFAAPWADPAPSVRPM